MTGTVAPRFRAAAPWTEDVAEWSGGCDSCAVVFAALLTTG